jgi:hypothetical protein
MKLIYKYLDVIINVSKENNATLYPNFSLAQYF